MANPYQSAESVSPPLAVGRETLVGALCRRLGARTPVLLSGDARCGKSTVLLAVAAHLEGEGWRTSLVQGTRLERRLTRARFWEDALHPLRDTPAHPTLSSAWRRARAHEFAPPILTELLQAVTDAGLHIALLLDDLEAILRQPTLGAALLEEVATLSASGQLALLGAGAAAPEVLSQRLAASAPDCARALDTWADVRLPALPPEAVDALLARGGAVFSDDDRAFLGYAGGQHAYLLQLLAEPLWEQRQRGGSPQLCREQSGGRALSAMEWTVGTAWRGWAPAARWVVLRAALAELDLVPPPLVFPPLPSPASQALLEVLARLDTEELYLLHEKLDGTALEPELRRPAALRALLALLIRRRLTTQALELVAAWHPEQLPLIARAAHYSGVQLAEEPVVEDLLQRGVLRQALSGTLHLDAGVMLWWLIDQLAPLARGDVDLPMWLRGQGLLPPSDGAAAHLLWRLDRLEGLLSRGAGPLLRDVAAENASRVAQRRAGR